VRRARSIIPVCGSFHEKSSDFARPLDRSLERYLDALLVLVLLVAGAVRFYALDVPVILFEEGLVANSSLHN